MSTSKLGQYRAKRDPSKTPEPMGSAHGVSKRRPTFVVQEHRARSLHWDLRLEHEGVLVSWAIPKGIPEDPSRNHLAVSVDDHPLEYKSFSGTIGKGQYGAGTVEIWDSGAYALEKWSDREVMVVLNGHRVKGRYVLFRTGGKNWMIHRMERAAAGWHPIPDLVRPMLCRSGELPTTSRGWRFEFKWDGVRAISYVEGGRIGIRSRNGLDVTGVYPELSEVGRLFGSRQAVLDGEIVAFDSTGRPNFGTLQQRMHVRDRVGARRLSERVSVTYLVFDVLHLDGRATLDLSYDERRRLLDSIGLSGDHCVVPSTHRGRPSSVLEAALTNGLEGVVCKRSTSSYRPGVRSREWIKVRGFKTQEVVLAGYTAGAGARSRTFGALLLGVPEERGLRYVGKVGSGFSDDELTDLSRRLVSLRTPKSSFGDSLGTLKVGRVNWVLPTLVGEVRFSERTSSGKLRQPVWRGLRPDKSPDDIVIEG
ncbi:MAG: non-homologous end-joining DNA ligase [Acidimicrobiales bacterium]